MHHISDVAKFQNKILHGTDEIIDEEHSHFITHSDTMIVTSPEISCELNQTFKSIELQLLGELYYRIQWNPTGFSFA